jgi:ABC-type transport system substrate-binding protein
MKTHKPSHAALTRREMLYLGAGGAAGLALAAGPGPAHGQQGKPHYGGRVRVGERFGSTGLDAHRNQAFIDFQNYVVMYNALTIMGPLPQVRIYPDLAKSWETSRDGREYTFPLREGVKFHHGKDLDSGDVKYSIERVMNPATRSPRAFAYRSDSLPVEDHHSRGVPGFPEGLRGRRRDLVRVLRGRHEEGLARQGVRRTGGQP